MVTYLFCGAGPSQMLINMKFVQTAACAVSVTKAQHNQGLEKQ
jgi:hypothetical protein